MNVQVCYIAFAVAFSLGTRYGLGLHIIRVTDPAGLAKVSNMSKPLSVETGLKGRHRLTIIQVNIADEVFYCIGLAVIKCSILALYRRIFPQRTLHLVIYATAFVLMGWAIGNSFASIFQCVPVAAQWNTAIQGKCTDYGLQVLISGIINIATDFWVLAIPIPVVLKLNASRSRKAGIIATFLAGGV